MWGCLKKIDENCSINIFQLNIWVKIKIFNKYYSMFLYIINKNFTLMFSSDLIFCALLIKK